MLHAARKYALHQLWGKYTGTSPTLAKRETKACFFIVVGQRDKDTLLAIIHARILPGTNVMSDLWRALIRLPKKVNRSLNLLNPNTAAHTQHIENT